MARANRRGATKRKGNVISVDFKGVESRGVTLPEGEYVCKVSEVTQEDGREYPYLKWEFEVAEGEFKGRKLFNNTSLSPQSLWNLRYMLEVLGVEVPDSEYDIDLDELTGGKLLVSVEHESYEGKKRARVVDTSPLDGSSEEEDDDDDSRGKKAKKSAKRRGDDNDEPEEDEDDKPSRRSSKKSSKKSRRDEDEDENEEEDEDDDRSSRRGKKAKKSKKAALTVDDVEDLDEEGLEDLIKEHDLEVDLDSARTLSKKRNLVIDALEEAELLEAA